MAIKISTEELLKCIEDDLLADSGTSGPRKAVDIPLSLLERVENLEKAIEKLIGSRSGE